MRLLVLAVLLLSGCTGLPKGVQPVAGFELDRYLGTWYEIARLDHRFERGLSRVTAEYSARPDGGVKVVNRGYSERKKRFSEATGKAYFVGQSDSGHLKVSFFGPFYASYVVFSLDDNYQQAFVSGNNRKYLWFLSRSPEVSDADMQRFKARATELGFALDKLISVDQSALQQP